METSPASRFGSLFIFPVNRTDLSAWPPQWANPTAGPGTEIALPWRRELESSWYPACWRAAQAQRCVAMWKGRAERERSVHIETKCWDGRERDRDILDVTDHTMNKWIIFLELTDLNKLRPDSNVPEFICDEDDSPLQQQRSKNLQQIAHTQTLQ